MQRNNELVFNEKHRLRLFDVSHSARRETCLRHACVGHASANNPTGVARAQICVYSREEIYDGCQRPVVVCEKSSVKPIKADCEREPTCGGTRDYTRKPNLSLSLSPFSTRIMLRMRRLRESVTV